MKEHECYVWLITLKEEETLGNTVVGGILMYEKKQQMKRGQD
jgi:hypothetical protein